MTGIHERYLKNPVTRDLDKIFNKLYVLFVLFNFLIGGKKFMAIVKTLSKGQIVIPADIRKRYHIEPGTEMQMMEYGGIIYLIPPVEDPIKAACGLLPPKPSLSEKLLRERKSEFR
jgi:AbrB family looped-hinge helix DNA binding protein